MGLDSPQSSKPLYISNVFNFAVLLFIKKNTFLEKHRYKRSSTQIRFQCIRAKLATYPDLLIQNAPHYSRICDNYVFQNS